MIRIAMLLVAFAAVAANAAGFSVTNLRTEYMENPLGLDKPRPRFTWELRANDISTRGLEQASYRLKVGDWDSGTVTASATFQVKYGGPPLSSGTVYHWSVVVTAKDGSSATSTDNSLFSMGLLTPSAWTGTFIGYPNAAKTLPNITSLMPCPWFRKSFTLPSNALSSATAYGLVYVASVGYHELYVNGQRASEHVLAPSTSYLPKRVLYRTYDVSSLLNPGEKNAIGIWAAPGWAAYPDEEHNATINVGNYWKPGAPWLLAELHTTGAGAFKLVSDSTWKVSGSTTDHLGGWGPNNAGFGGDALDDSKDIPGWNTAALDDSSWEAPTTTTLPLGMTLSADVMELTRRESTVHAVSVVSTAASPSASAVVVSSYPSASNVAADAEIEFCGTSTKDDNGHDAYQTLQITCTNDGDFLAKVRFADFGHPEVSGGGCKTWQSNTSCTSGPAFQAWVVKQCVGQKSCIIDINRELGPGGKFKECNDHVASTLAFSGMCGSSNNDGKAVARNSGGPPPPPPPGTHVVKMSELYTGWFEVANMKGLPGSTVTFQISSDPNAALEYNQINTFTFGPSGTGTFVMRFSYQEIQYITITGLTAAPAAGDVVGYRLTSLGNRTGNFECSNELISQMYGVTVNNYRGLTTGGHTVDCPHRERRGYGGDGHTSYQFGLANYPVGAYFNKWTRDFADIQTEEGWVPHTAPTVSGGGGPAWSGFVMTNPWQTYNTFGDVDILENMYPTMVRLLSFYTNNTLFASDGLLHAWGPSMWNFLGDWITPHGSESDVKSAENILFNNCYVHYITELTAKISTILGNDAAAAKYHADAAKLALAITKAYGNASTGEYVDRLQTHAVMPLISGVATGGGLENKTWAVLESSIRVGSTVGTQTYPNHLDTGLTGTYFLTKLLMESGRNDLIFAYANQTTFPSYGYFLSLGRTTWPEDWSGMYGSSLMHGCYNAIGLWFVEGIAGIRIHMSEEYPVSIRAGVDAGDITHASGERTAFAGLAKSAWNLSAAGFSHAVILPPNGVAARVLIPSSNGAAGVKEGGGPVETAIGVTVLGVETINKIEYVSLKVVAGSYAFTSSWTRAGAVSAVAL